MENLCTTARLCLALLHAKDTDLENKAPALEWGREPGTWRPEIQSSNSCGGKSRGCCESFPPLAETARVQYPLCKIRELWGRICQCHQNIPQRGMRPSKHARWLAVLALEVDGPRLNSCSDTSKLCDFEQIVRLSPA